MPESVEQCIACPQCLCGSRPLSGRSATRDPEKCPIGVQVTVENPPPPLPQASKLTDCDFANVAKIKKPWRVDNECKGKLDDVAKNLQQNADNKLVIVGNADPSEQRPNLAAERAVNSKAYLTSGEAQLGIDPNRIECRTGSAGTMTAEYWINADHESGLWWCEGDQLYG